MFFLCASFTCDWTWVGFKRIKKYQKTAFLLLAFFHAPQTELKSNFKIFKPASYLTTYVAISMLNLVWSNWSCLSDSPQNRAKNEFLEFFGKNLSWRHQMTYRLLLLSRTEKFSFVSRHYRVKFGAILKQNSRFTASKRIFTTLLSGRFHKNDLPAILFSFLETKT